MVLVVWDNWSNFICCQLPSFLVKASLTDVTISVGSKSIKTHRIILSFFSPFFKKMFDDVGGEQPVVVVFPDVSFQALQIVIAYMYQGQVNVPGEILQQVTDLAKMLKVKGLTKIPSYFDSVIAGDELKTLDGHEEFDDNVEDHIDFASEAESIVELEVSPADSEPTVSNKLQVLNPHTAVTIITNTSCVSPRKNVQSPIHCKNIQQSIPHAAITSGIDIQKSESSSEEHILIQSEDIQMSTVDELTPTHIVKLSEDGSMSEVLFSDEYSIDEGRILEDQTISKEFMPISDEQKHITKRRRESLYKPAKYGPDDLAKALEDLKAGNGTLREIAQRWGVPKSTLSVTARISGISLQQKTKTLDYDDKAVEEAKQAVRAGASYVKAAREFSIPKSVLWRKCQRDGVLAKGNQRYFTYTDDDLLRARQMLCDNQSLSDIAFETKIPKTTVFRLKEQLIREGKMPASCISRICRPRKLSEGSLQQAVEACKEGGLSLSQASEKLQVAKTTVWRRLKKMKEFEATSSEENHIKMEVPDTLALNQDNYHCYELTEAIHKGTEVCKAEATEVNCVESSNCDGSENTTIVIENSESFLHSERDVIHASVKQESNITAAGGNAVVTDNSSNTHFELEMPLVNFPSAEYQVVGSEIVIGGQHMVVLDSADSSDHSHDNADSHIVVAPFDEMEVSSASGSCVQSSSELSSKEQVYHPVQESLSVSTSSEDISVCLQSIKSESSAQDQQKSVSDEERMSELITEFISVD